MNLLAEAELSLLPFVKIAILIGLILYIIFTVVVVRQVNLMNETLDLGHEKIIRLLSFIHLALAVLVFLLALIIL